MSRNHYQVGWVEIIMKKDGKENAGIQLLLKKYRSAFRIPENIEYYSKTDYETAEKKFLQYALMERKVDIQREVQEAQQHS